MGGVGKQNGDEMSDKYKYEVVERPEGLYVYEDGVFIGLVDLSEFPMAGFMRLVRAANKESEVK